ncbi:SHOCT domain-containing protein [Enterococcus avium]|uniref:SHOCT domain-containing protein n=1 Tax=Enterococcus avium TaxID=33945 RepID=A0AAW8S041_ENTAV|nr:SHOCT domain-containing protein [Enterococcus avium]MDT2404006.1 SHOCT domain-containing protein [Enterococcus avium]MDT2423024.1 SHOCT domain-containing protein [Enterococcus avium]
MGFWDSVKSGAKDIARQTSLENMIQNNKELSTDEVKEFIEFSKMTPDEAIAKKPARYFKSTNRYGEVEIDSVKKLFRVKLNVYTFDELNSYELLENGSSVMSGGLGIGRAVVGGVLAGGVGAVLGGVTKKKKQRNHVDSLKIMVTFKNRTPQSVTLDYIKKKQEKDKKYEKALMKAKETMAGFDYIVSELEIDRHDELVSSTSVQKEQPTTSADEIRKFKELLDEGIISQEEFDAKKKELLNL